MRHTIAPTSIIQRLFRCKRYTSNILLALRPKLFKLIALSLVVECLKKRGTIVMKRQWALTTLSQEDLTQPNFIVSTRTESRRGMSQSQSRSDQDLVRTHMGPRSQDNLPVPSADIPEDSSKSVPNLHANEKGKKSPKQNAATSPTNKADNSPLSSHDTLKVAKRSISSLPSKYLSEFFPLIKLEPMQSLNRNHQYTIKLEYVPPISRQMSRRTQRRLNSLPKNHTINFKRKKVLAKSSQKAKINRMMKNELKPLKCLDFYTN